MNELEFRKRFLNEQAAQTLVRAVERSRELVAEAGRTIGLFLNERSISADDLCFTLVGSVGRSEALEASDLDLIPIARDEAALAAYVAHDQALRAFLKAKMGIKVSKGEDLTSPTCISQLTDPKCIGGEADSSTALTKRVLLLTESRQCHGGLELKQIKRQLLQEYGRQERTSGRHFLTLCNDVARYYKTLCIEYKAKIDGDELDWGTRNIKLRHSRKMWYFSMIYSMSRLAEDHPKGDERFREALLDDLDRSPVERLLTFAEAGQMPTLSKLISSYAFFLSFMAVDKNREALAQVKHEERYAPDLANPFPAMKFNSDLLHESILNFLEDAGPARRARILSWFLF